MDKYTTKSKQNIYDVALTLYGSIEGIFDLMISNTDLSLNSVIEKGAELNYHSGFTINRDIIVWLEDNNVTVRNSRYNYPQTDIDAFIMENKEEGDNAVKALCPNGHQPFRVSLGGKPLPNVITTPIYKTEVTGNADYKKWKTPEINYKTDIIVRNSDLLNYVKELTGVDLSSDTDINRAGNLEIFFDAGMIYPFHNQDEQDRFYAEMGTPKIVIAQSGTASVINAQLLPSKFMVVDWGDDKGLEFYHYSNTTLNLIHDYSDSGEHQVRVYGFPGFYNLDLSKVGGMYYALSNVQVRDQFITQYPQATSLNKLFTNQ